MDLMRCVTFQLHALPVLVVVFKQVLAIFTAGGVISLLVIRLASMFFRKAVTAVHRDKLVIG